MPRRGRAPSGVSVNAVAQGRQDLAGRHHLRALPGVPGVERHLLDEAQLVAVARRRQRSRSAASSSLTPRISTVLILTGPGRRRGRPPGRRGRPCSRSRRVISANRSGRRVSRETLTRSRPAAARAARRAGEADAVGGQRDVRARSERGRRDDLDSRPRRSSGSPPVKRTSRTPRSRTRDGDQPDELVVGQLLGSGHPGQALGGHAVGAAQVAAVGQRDPQVRGDPAEAVRQGCRHGCRPVGAVARVMNRKVVGIIVS